MAETAWEYEKFTEAKKLLVSVLTPELPELIKQEKDKEFRLARTGTDRNQRKIRDINDIVNILEFLSGRNIMPLMMTSLCQMRKTPKSLGSQKQLWEKCRQRYSCRELPGKIYGAHQKAVPDHD